MKKKQFFYGLVVLMVSCKAGKSDNVLVFIPGMYVKPINHEFAHGSDTLIIRPLEGSTYEITKRSAFQRIRNGKILPLERTSETWIGIYDANDQVIHEQRKGKLLSFVPKENKLLVGATAYQKVN
jgi:hypothetical protein